MLTFWKSNDRSSISIQGVEVHSFIQAAGIAELKFQTHALYLMESQAETMHAIGSMSVIRESYLPYTLVFIPKGVPLFCQPVSPFDITTLLIPEHWFRTAMRGTGSYDALNLMPFTTATDAVLLNAVTLLKSVVMEMPSYSKPERVASLITAVAERSIRRAANVLIRGEVSALRLDQIDLFVDRNMGRRISLTELADTANMSPSHFSREFKSVANVTPMQYVAERRIDMAKLMLAGTLSMAEIAFDCGFASQSHFTTSFRQATGMTPTAWRSACGK